MVLANDWLIVRETLFDHDVRIDDGGFSVALTASALP